MTTPFFTVSNWLIATFTSVDALMTNVVWLPDANITAFPAVARALREPDGLLAVGGNLSTGSLLAAYQQGVFPWFNEGDPIMWWSPSVRAVIPTDSVYISKNMAKLMRGQRYRLCADSAFSAVVTACAARSHTWITPEMRDAYCALHADGMAHSVEVFDDKNSLVGGLYGVFVKNIFCGESMFSLVADTSKLALIYLANFLQKHHCLWIDCQMPTAHLTRMGAIAVSRCKFVAELDKMEDNALLRGVCWRGLWQSY